MSSASQTVTSSGTAEIIREWEGDEEAELYLEKKRSEKQEKKSAKQQRKAAEFLKAAKTKKSRAAGELGSNDSLDTLEMIREWEGSDEAAEFEEQWGSTKKERKRAREDSDAESSSEEITGGNYD